MSALNPKQAAALKALVEAVIAAVAASGPIGAPGGVLYAALMEQGCTLNQFESLMGALVRCGKLVKKGECYHVAV